MSNSTNEQTLVASASNTNNVSYNKNSVIGNPTGPIPLLATQPNNVGMEVAGGASSMNNTHMIDSLAPIAPQIYAIPPTNGGSSVGLTDATTNEMITRETLIDSINWTATSQTGSILSQGDMPQAMFNSTAFTAKDLLKIRRYFNGKSIKFTIQMSPPTFAAGAVQLIWYPSVSGFPSLFSGSNLDYVTDSMVDGTSLIVDIGTQGTGEIIFPLENMLSNLPLPVYNDPKAAFVGLPGFDPRRFNLFGSYVLKVWNSLKVAPDAPIKEIPIKLFATFMEPTALGLYAPMEISIDFVKSLDNPEFFGPLLAFLGSTLAGFAPTIGEAAGGLVSSLVTSGITSLVGKHCTAFTALDSPNVLNACLTGDHRTISLLGYKPTDMENKSIEVGGDNPSISDICKKRGRIIQAQWGIATPIGDQVMLPIPIWPRVSPYYDQQTAGIYTLQPTPMASMAKLFRLWRGSIDVTIQVVGNSFMKGALAIVYIPANATAPTTLQDISARPNIILNIASDRAVKVNIPFNHPLDWCTMAGTDDVLLTGTSGILRPKSPDQHLGYLAVYCWNTLQQVTSTAPTDLNINVYVSSDDMRFVNPGEPIGVYSDVNEFIVNKKENRNRIVTLDVVESGVKIYGDNTLTRNPTHLDVDHMDLRQLLTRRRLVKGNIVVPQFEAVSSRIQLPSRRLLEFVAKDDRVFLGTPCTIFDSIVTSFAFYTGTNIVTISSGGTSTCNFYSYVKAFYQGDPGFSNDFLSPRMVFGPISIDSGEFLSSNGSVLTCNHAILPIHETCVANYSPYKMISTYSPTANSVTNMEKVNYIPYGEVEIILDGSANLSPARANVYISAGPNFLLSMYLGAKAEYLSQTPIVIKDTVESGCCSILNPIKLNNHIASSHFGNPITCPITNKVMEARDWWKHKTICDCAKPMICGICGIKSNGLVSYKRHLNNSHDRVEIFGISEATTATTNFIEEIGPAALGFFENANNAAGPLKATMDRLATACDSISTTANQFGNVADSITSTLQDFRNISPVHALKGIDSGMLYGTIVAGNNALKDESFRPILDHIIVIMLQDIELTPTSATGVFSLYSLIRSIYQDDKDSGVYTTVSSVLASLGAAYGVVQSFTEVDTAEYGVQTDGWSKGVAILIGAILCTASNFMPISSFMEIFPTSANLSKILGVDRTVASLGSIIQEVSEWFTNAPTYAANVAAMAWFKQNEQLVVDWITAWGKFSGVPNNMNLANRDLKERGLELGQQAKDIMLNLSHLEKHSPYIKNVIAACKTAIVFHKQASQGCLGTRPRPVVLTLQGASQVGKSFLTNDLIPRYVAKEMGWPDAKSIYSIPPKDSYFSGYAQQRVALIDDAFQDPESGIFDYFCQMVSNTDFLPAMPDLPDKGMKFSSRLLLLTMNPPMPNVAKRSSDPGAYYERIFDNYYSVKPHKDYLKNGKLDNTKLALDGSVLHPDKYLIFTQWVYDNDRKERRLVGDVKFSQIIREVCDKLKAADMVAKRLDATVELPPLDLVESGLYASFIDVKDSLYGMSRKELDDHYYANQYYHNLDWDDCNFDCLMAGCEHAIATDPFFLGLFGVVHEELSPWIEVRKTWQAPVSPLAKVYKSLEESVCGAMDKVKNLVIKYKKVVYTVGAILGIVVAVGAGATLMQKFLGKQEAYNSDPRLQRAPRIAKQAMRAKISTNAPKTSVSPFLNILDDAEGLCSTHLFTAIHKNMLRLDYADKHIRGIGIKDSFILVNKHFLDEVPEGALVEVTRPGRTSENPIVFSFPLTHRKVCYLENEHGIMVDFAVIDAGFTASPFKNILKHFLKSELMAKVIGNGGYRLEYLPMGIDKNSVGIQFNTTTLRDVQTKYSHSVATLDSSILTHPMVFIAHGPRSPGLCGSPWIISGGQDFHDPGKIVGIHAFGGPSGMGCVPVAVEYLETAMEMLSRTEITPTLQDLTLDYTEASRDSDYHTVVGKVSMQNAFFSPRNTALKKSPLHGEVVAVTHGPSVLSKFDRRLTIEPESFRTNLLTKTDKPVSWFKEVHPDMDEVMLELYSSQPRFTPGLLSDDEVINGAIDEPWATGNGLRMDKSPGYPYNKHTSGKPGKTAFFTMHDDRYTIDSQLLSENLSVRESDAVKGLVKKDSIWMDCLKDELRSNEKISSGSTRIINAPPLDFMMMVGKYMGAFRKHFMDPENMGFKFESALGVDPNSFWAELAIEMEGYKIFGIDYKQYDSTIHSHFWYLFGKCLNSWYKKFDPNWKIEDDRVRDTLCYEGAHTLHIFEDELYYDHHGNPSGFPGGFTTIFNIFVNSYISRVAFSRLGRHPGAFKDHVIALFLGDDNIQIVKTDIRYDRVLLAEVASELKMQVTMPDKSNTITPYDTFDTVTFLKRGFVKPRGSPVHLPGIDKQTICNLLNWYRPGANEMQYRENCRQALSFLAPYGREEYQKLRSVLVAKTGFQDLPSWYSSIDLYLAHFGGGN
nr:MAG: polyprotein [Eriocheir sinensis picorna-like virus]